MLLNKLNLLNNTTVVNDAIRFVTEHHRSKPKTHNAEYSFFGG
jgi:hypothetical protein